MDRMVATGCKGFTNLLFLKVLIFDGGVNLCLNASNLPA